MSTLQGRAEATTFEGQPAVSLRSPDGARATVLLHGAHLVSWQPAGGEEQLYLSPTTAYGEGQAVRGGVPVIFPQFAARGPGPRHGFARTRGWQLDQAVVRGAHALAVLVLEDDEATRAVWPHAFRAELTVSLGAGQIDIELAITNTGEAPFEFAAALHTYLRSGDVLKAQIEGLQGAHYEDAVKGGERAQQWGDVMSVVGEVDRLYLDTPRQLLLREMGRKLGLEQHEFNDTVVWNPGPDKAAALKDLPPDDWRHFVCIEAAQVMEPILLLPGDEWAGMQSLIA